MASSHDAPPVGSCRSTRSPDDPIRPPESDEGRSDQADPCSLPQQIDEYRLTRLLGKGGMGEVHLAHDVSLERDVAIKLMARRGRKNRERFAREARAAARLHHPNIVAVYRVGEIDGLPYIASEYVSGQTLAAMSKPIPGDRALELAIGIAQGLAAAHRQGVMHRDIKPDNVIVDEHGVPKITDFGLAKLLDLRPRSPGSTSGPESDAALEPAPEPTPEPEPRATSETTPRSEPAPDRADRGKRLTRAGAIVGTPSYVSPEIWLGESASLRSDVYSFGALLYELCTGRAPHEDTALDDLPLIAVIEDAPPLGQQNPAIDPDFVAVIERCLARDPERRFASGDAVLDALTALREVSPVVEIPPGGPYRGLLPFEAEHQGLFFGRDSDIRGVVDRLRTQPVVVVTGESGAGKSSLLRAGVAPRIAGPGLGDGRVWRSVVFVPGVHPLASLAAELARHTELDETGLFDELRHAVAVASQSLRDALGRDTGLLLVADQLEELVTLSDPARAALASRAMVELARRTPGLRLVATVRGDKLTELARLPGLGQELERSLYILRPLDDEQIRQTIVGPAAAAGVHFESQDTVSELVRGTTRASAGLPLLQFALTELWNARDRDRQVIPDRALETLGGIQGALSRHADSVLDTLLPDIRRAARDILVQLVTLHGTRARQSEAELTGETDRAKAPATRDASRTAALRALVAGRLVVARERDGQSTYAIAHEALITHWVTLRGWIDEQDSARVIRQRLALAAETWERMDRTRGALWRDRSLRRAEELDIAKLSALERNFVAASRREETRGRRIRRSLAIAAFLVLAVGLIVVLQLNRQGAIQRERAENLAIESLDNEIRAERHMIDLYVEQGRQRLLDGDPMGAFAYLAEARRQGADDVATRFMLTRAARRLEGQIAVLPGHQGLITWVELGPDGRFIATAGWDGVVQIWNAETLTRIHILDDHEGPVWMLDFSPDGQHIATAGFDGAVHVHAVATGALEWSARHDDRVYWVGYTPDGSQIGSASIDRSARFWDARSGAPLTVMAGHSKGISRAALSRDGRILVTAGRDSTARAWDVATGQPLALLADHRDMLSGVAVAPDGAWAATASLDTTARVFPTDGGEAMTLAGHALSVTSVAFAPDGTHVITASDDRLAKTWNIATGRQRLTLQGHDSGVTSARYSPDGHSILTTSRDGTTRIWEANTGDHRWTFIGHRDAVWMVQVAPGRGWLLTAGFDGSARVWSLDQVPHHRIYGVHDSEVQGARFSPDGTRIATIQRDGIVRIWNRGGTELLSFDAGRHRSHIAWSPDSTRLVTSGGTWTELTINAANARPAEVWDARSGVRLFEMSDHAGWIFSALYDRPGARIVTASADGTARIRDARSGQVLLTLLGHDGAVRHAAFSPDGAHVVTAGADRTARIWDATSGAEIQVLRGHTLPLQQARYTADGSRILTASDDQTARIWTADGAVMATLEGHRNSVSSAVSTAEGDLVVTASADGTATIWDSASARRLWSIDLHLHAAWSLDLDPTGQYVLIASAKRATSWDITHDPWTPGRLAAFESCRIDVQLARGRVIRREIDHAACRRP